MYHLVKNTQYLNLIYIYISINLKYKLEKFRYIVSNMQKKKIIGKTSLSKVINNIQACKKSIKYKIILKLVLRNKNRSVYQLQQFLI